jgi:uncharacterized protein (DUF433 family)
MKNEMYGGIDPCDMPAYTPAEAAFLVGVPSPTLRGWFFGRTYPPGRIAFAPVLVPADPRGRTLSFTNVVEAHVLGGLRGEHGIRLPAIRTAMEQLRKDFGHAHPLATMELETDGVSLWIRHLGELVNLSAARQQVLAGVVEAKLRRVERDHAGIAARFYPWLRGGVDTGKKTLLVDPRVSFGRPVVIGTGVPAAVLGERWRGGETIAELAADYDIATDQVEDAIRCVERRAA